MRRDETKAYFAPCFFLFIRFVSVSSVLDPKGDTKSRHNHSIGLRVSRVLFCFSKKVNKILIGDLLKAFILPFVTEYSLQPLDFGPL